MDECLKMTCKCKIELRNMYYDGIYPLSKDINKAISFYEKAADKQGFASLAVSTIEEMKKYMVIVFSILLKQNYKTFKFTPLLIYDYIIL